MANILTNKFYDQMAIDFLNRNTTFSTNKEREFQIDLTDHKEYFAEKEDKNKIEDMKINIPLKNKIRHPGQCDVLTTYFEINDKRINRISKKIENKMNHVLPSNFDIYFPEYSTYHISLVMIHDLRPVDMNNSEMLLHRKSEKEIQKINDLLSEVNIKPFTINLYGLRIGSDGCGLFTFSDDGNVEKLRSVIGDKISPYLQGEYLKYKKPFIHTTIFRILDQVDGGTYEKIKDIQREYFCVLNSDISLKIKKFEFSRETSWQHTKIQKLNIYNFK